MIIFVAAVFGFVFQGKDDASVSVTDFESCAMSGNPIMESYPRQCRTPDGRSFTEDIGNELEKSDLIIVENPRPNQVISSPLQIKGQARGTWFFEGSFPAKLLDDNGKVLAIKPLQSQGEWMTTEFVLFVGTFEFPMPETEKGVLVLQKDNPSDLRQYDDELRIPIRFEKYAKSSQTTVKVFFGKEGVSETDCSEVIAVSRTVLKTEALGRAAINELLKGPTAVEKSTGFFTSLNEGVMLKSLRITEGVAYAEFDEALGRSVGGSCRVQAIRAQITETLKQFPTIEEVVISIDGRTEDILQP